MAGPLIIWAGDCISNWREGRERGGGREEEEEEEGEIKGICVVNVRTTQLERLLLAAGKKGIWMVGGNARWCDVCLSFLESPRSFPDFRLLHKFCLSVFSDQWDQFDLAGTIQSDPSSESKGTADLGHVTRDVKFQYNGKVKRITGKSDEVSPGWGMIYRPGPVNEPLA